MKRRSNGEGSITQRRDGRWAAALFDVDGTRRWYYGHTRGEVATKLKAALDARRPDAPVVPNTLTFAEWATEWLALTQPALRHGGWRKHEERMRNHILPALGRIPLQALAADHLDRLYARKLQGGPLAAERPRHPRHDPRGAGPRRGATRSRAMLRTRSTRRAARCAR